MKGSVSLAAMGRSSGTAQKRNFNSWYCKAAGNVAQYGQKTTESKGETALSKILLLISSGSLQGSDPGMEMQAV